MAFKDDINAKMERPLLVKVKDYGDNGGIIPHEDDKDYCPMGSPTACISRSGDSFCGCINRIIELGGDRYMVCSDIHNVVSEEQMDEEMREYEAKRWRKPAALRVTYDHKSKAWRPRREEKWMCPHKGEKACFYERGGEGLTCGCFVTKVVVSGYDHVICRDGQIDYVPRSE